MSEDTAGIPPLLIGPESPIHQCNNRPDGISDSKNQTEVGITERSDLDNVDATIQKKESEQDPGPLADVLVKKPYVASARQQPLPACNCLLTKLPKAIADSPDADAPTINTGTLDSDAKCEHFLASTKLIADLKLDLFMAGEANQLLLNQYNRQIEEMSSAIVQLTNKVSTMTSQLESKYTENQDILEHNNDLIEQLTSLNERATLAEVKISELESDLIEERENNEKLSLCKVRMLKLEEKLQLLEQEHEYELYEGSLLRKNEFQYKRRERNLERWIDMLSKDNDRLKENNESKKPIYDDDDTFDENCDIYSGNNDRSTTTLGTTSISNNKRKSSVSRNRSHSQASSMTAENSILVKELDATKDRLRQLEMILLHDNSNTQPNKLRQAKSSYTLNSKSRNSLFKDYIQENHESQDEYDPNSSNEYQDRYTPRSKTFNSNNDKSRWNNPIQFKRSLPNLSFNRLDDQNSDTFEEETYSPPYTPAPTTPVHSETFTMESTSGDHSEGDIRVSKRRASKVNDYQKNVHKKFENDKRGDNNAGHDSPEDEPEDYFLSQQVVREIVNDNIPTEGDYVNPVVPSTDYEAFSAQLKPRLYRSTSHESILSTFSTVNKAPYRASFYNPASHLAAYATPITTTSSLTASSSIIGMVSKSNIAMGSNSKPENGSASRYLSSRFLLNTSTITTIGDNDSSNVDFDARRTTSNASDGNINNRNYSAENNTERTSAYRAMSAQRAISMPIVMPNSRNDGPIPSTAAPSTYRWTSILSKFSLTKPTLSASESIPATSADRSGPINDVIYEADNENEQAPSASASASDNNSTSANVNLPRSASTGSPLGPNGPDSDANGIYPRPKFSHRRVVSSKISHAALRDALGEVGQERPN